MNIAALLVYVKAIDNLITIFVVDSFVFHLHQDFDRGLDVVKHCEAIEFCESISFFFELVVSKSINLN